VINEATNTVTATIGVGSDPSGIGVDPSTHTVYVTNSGSGTVSVINEATNTVTATIGVGNYPNGVGVDPSTHAVYVTNTGSGTVSVITPVSDADLSLATPASITTDATGPSGATVSYALPQVSDPDDTSVTAASCTPTPGSVFAIGTTTVHCSASDPDDSNSAVTVSFTVTVKGAADQLTDLHQAVRHVGIGKSLAHTVAAAQHLLAARHPRLACVTLTAFMIEVTVQTPRFIPVTTSAQLITDANRIQAVLAC
jgi:YVTN family beta-propeller protein